MVKEERRVFIPEDTPLYEQVGDLLLIGTYHAPDTLCPEKRTRFIRELQGRNHLILEGTRQINERDRRETSFSTIALDNHVGEVHYLEEDADFFKILTQQGIRPELIGAYHSLRPLPSLCSTYGKDKGKILDALLIYLRLTKKQYPGFQNLVVENTFKKSAELIQDTEDVSVLWDIGIAFAWYLADVRNQYVIGPKSKEFYERLRGTKVEIVGASHVDFLVRFLRGEHREPVPRWEAYVGNLEKKVRSAIRKIEQR